MVEIAREADEGVGDEQDAHGGEDERQRDGSPHQTGRQRPVESHGGARSHDADRQRDRLPEAQLAPQAPLLARPGIRAHPLPPPVKMSSGRKAPTTQLGASTTSWMRKSTATLHRA